MTCPCETVESLATATSTVTPKPTVVAVGEAVALNTLFPKDTVLLTGSGVASSTATPGQYALPVGSAAGSSTTTAVHTHRVSLTDTGRGRSRTFLISAEVAVSSAGAGSQIAYAGVPTVLVLSAASAASTTTPRTTGRLLLANAAAAGARVWPGQKESLTSAGTASSNVTPRRVAALTLTASAVASSSLDPSARPPVALLTGSAQAASTLTLQASHRALVLEASEAASTVWFKDPGRGAWLLNTESTAMSRYSQFHFDAVVQTRSKVLAVGPDGLYELTGATDAGSPIQASLKSGFLDFGSARTKHLEHLYFGYVSTGILSAEVEVKDSGYPAYSYTLEQRAAGAPRNSRVTPGKGLWGRYWRFTIRNVAGAGFTIHDAAFDVAESTRRI